MVSATRVNKYFGLLAGNLGEIGCPIYVVLLFANENE